MDRIETDLNPKAAIDGSSGPTIGLDVAIIDTGLDRDHEDLNVAGGRDCVGVLATRGTTTTVTAATSVARSARRTTVSASSASLPACASGQ